MDKYTRETLGRKVRETWVKWAEKQPNPKSSWLVAYDELNEQDKDADRCIGSAIWWECFNYFKKENARLLSETITLSNQIQNLKEHMEPFEGHNKPCYYCGELCNGLAGDPGQWPVPLCHPDDPGRVKWHHINCVTTRLKDIPNKSDKV